MIMIKATITILMILAIYMIASIKPKSKPLNIKELDKLYPTAKKDVSQLIIEHYNSNNIKLPLDIIEELENIKSSDIEILIDYVELQRYNWRHENSKKIKR